MRNLQNPHHYVYIIVRTDLPLRQQLVQAAHAAHESGIWLAEKKTDTSSIIILQTSDEKSLKEAHEVLSPHIDLVMFKEPDIGGQCTAFASKPITGEHRNLFKNFKLWSHQ